MDYIDIREKSEVVIRQAQEVLRQQPRRALVFEVGVHTWVEMEALVRAAPGRHFVCYENFQMRVLRLFGVPLIYRRDLPEGTLSKIEGPLAERLVEASRDENAFFSILEGRSTNQSGTGFPHKIQRGA